MPKDFRADGRNFNQIRPHHAELGLVSAASGSCRLQVGSTEVIATVFGPRQPRFSRHEKFDEAVLEVECTALGIRDNLCNMKVLNHQLKALLHPCIAADKYPRSLISISISIVNDDGSAFSAAFNASIIALLDAGIPMNAVPLSVDVLFSNAEKCCFLDPVRAEVAQPGLAHMVVVSKETKDKDATIESIVFSKCAGPVAQEDFLQTCDLACKANTAMRNFVRDLFRS